MTKSQRSQENQAGQRELATGDTSAGQPPPDQEVRPEDAQAPTSPQDGTITPGSADPHPKKGRGVVSARRPDEEPPFSDD